MESLHSQGYHFGFSEDMQHQQMIGEIVANY